MRTMYIYLKIRLIRLLKRGKVLHVVNGVDSDEKRSWTDFNDLFLCDVIETLPKIESWEPKRVVHD